jgi:four helix bundle protein
MKREELSTTNSQQPTANGAGEERKIFNLEERLTEYAARIIRLVDAIPATRAGNHIGGQLLRSGTSPLSNHGEAQAAESLPDFIHKLKLALKELEESRRWLCLIRRVPLLEKPEMLDLLITETTELIYIFAKSIGTARSRAKDSSRVREDLPDDSSEWLPIPASMDIGSWQLAVESFPSLRPDSLPLEAPFR